MAGSQDSNDSPDSSIVAVATHTNPSRSLMLDLACHESFRLADLPLELRWEIYSYCDNNTLAALRNSSRQLRMETEEEAFTKRLVVINTASIEAYLQEKLHGRIAFCDQQDYRTFDRYKALDPGPEMTDKNIAVDLAIARKVKSLLYLSPICFHCRPGDICAACFTRLYVICRRLFPSLEQFRVIAIYESYGMSYVHNRLPRSLPGLPERMAKHYHHPAKMTFTQYEYSPDIIRKIGDKYCLQETLSDEEERAIRDYTLQFGFLAKEARQAYAGKELYLRSQVARSKIDFNLTVRTISDAIKLPHLARPWALIATSIEAERVRRWRTVRHADKAKEVEENRQKQLQKGKPGIMKMSMMKIQKLLHERESAEQHARSLRHAIKKEMHSDPEFQEKLQKQLDDASTYGLDLSYLVRLAAKLWRLLAYIRIYSS
ncbi:hypothetical protein BT63DRAFT_410577 [Microthyrium microscopicum]|uniref:F-box domain-containing protein n=1 Tax=Microthyrium microscopicum TaxID=703497 RepID=A0A6A6UP93_9PEZI|nr:hypothetical protein BT63DRAFT_410577 [Microthyrium microscopicum]